MPIHAFGIFTLGSKSARSHPGDVSERIQFGLGRFVEMLVTAVLIRAVSSKVMDIA
jgi:hypothetical protein